MNNILFRSNNDIDKANYKEVIILVLFLVFKIFYTGIYPFINGEGNLYLVFKPLLFYIIYYLILILSNKKSDSYYIVSSLIISFIIPINTPIDIFIIGSIIGSFISGIFKNKINSVIISSLLVVLYLSITNNYIVDDYTGIFLCIYILLCCISFIYLITNKLVKIRILLFSLISIVFINNMYDITLFSLLFIISDNRYAPITRRGQIVSAFLLVIIIYMLKYIFKLDYYLFLSVFFYEIISVFINYLNIKLYGNRIFRFLFSN